MDKLIYLDNAATTKTYEEVAKLVCELSTNEFFNPSALYKQSVDNQVRISEARDYLKKSIHAQDGEIYFVSGGTEADNTALFCSRKIKGSRIIVGNGEHDAIINAAKELAQQGFDVQFCDINKDGSINEEAFKSLLNEKVALVSIMHVSNETGAINDIAKLCKLTKRVAPNAIFHSDGVQALEKVNVNLRTLGVDLYSMSGHKIHGPKGIGALYVKKGTSIRPFIVGGGQEKGFRSGTENYPSILGFIQAVRQNDENFDKNQASYKEFKETLKNVLQKEIEDVVIITPDNSVNNILTVAFKDVRGEVLLHSIEKYGILVGIGSACSSHHESRFKQLLGLDDQHKDGIIRFSFDEFNKVEDIPFIVGSIKKELEILQNYKRV